ncbi:Arabinose operon regulatory protein [Sporomusa ovata DSM 2662]|uniref:Transcriptional regulator, AraC family n=1 Tax=Sporomusa ovata TaxID=2378 RepID=A0A0U1L0S4_9FIRM|nr:helix-turn-helix domain-containing protein [Sporomusa ovata]EQB27417.1 transcriptional regulator, AraC family [Sporomusa ovata DSM 2662]CQR73262.1 Transcriptional regulator, AraC family [Sporomusa ovata]
MEYMTVQEAAKKWGISVRRVQYLCNHKTIRGITKLGKFWIIPRELGKPKDSRYKLNEEKQNDSNQPMQSLGENIEVFSKIIEFFPYPIHVYAPDGTMILTNEECLRVMHIPSKDKIIGKFNVLQDPIIDEWGEDTRRQIIRSFQGEFVQFQGLVMPIQNILRRFESNEVCSDISIQNIICFPIFHNDSQLAYVVHVFITARIYTDEEKMSKAKKYIEEHWIEEFDLSRIAQSVNLSKYHFSRLFKKETSITPFNYYQDIKIAKLKDTLCDRGLSISEAFSACGLDYNGNYAKVFKNRVGLTPSQYRKMIGQK